MRIALPAILSLCTGCAPLLTPFGVAITAGATGGTMAMQERGLGAGLEDNALALAINDAWLQADPALFRLVSTRIADGTVVLVGRVRHAATSARAEAITRDVAGVREVINLVQVGDGPAGASYADDLAATLRLRAVLTASSGINAINYAIDTTDGLLVVTGIARDGEELAAVVRKAKAIPGVRDVAVAVRLASEPALARRPMRADTPLLADLSAAR